MLGVSPAIGRGFTEEEDEIGNERVVLLERRALAPPIRRRPVDRRQAITLSGVPHTVVGVMGPDFQYPGREFQVWTPLTINPGELTRKVRGNNYLAVARLKPGVTIEEAQTEMNAIAARIAAADPQTLLPEVVVVPTHADLLTNVRSALYVMLGAVLCLLLVAALNLSTLLSARAAARSRELAVRLALGASRGRVALQSMAEIMPLLAIGGAAGVALAAYAVEAFVPLAPPTLPRVENIRDQHRSAPGLDRRVVGHGPDRHAAAGVAGLERRPDQRDARGDAIDAPARCGSRARAMSWSSSRSRWRCRCSSAACC